MLPEISGYDLLEYIRPTETPVIIISAMGQVQDRIRGLKMGADDYLVKPFQIGELVARVESVLRRTGRAARVLTCGDVKLDLESRTVEKAGAPVVLTVKEFDLLATLIRNRNVALTRCYLYETVWDEEYLGETGHWTATSSVCAKNWAGVSRSGPCSASAIGSVSPGRRLKRREQ